MTGVEPIEMTLSSDSLGNLDGQPDGKLVDMGIKDGSVVCVQASSTAEVVDLNPSGVQKLEISEEAYKARGDNMRDFIRQKKTAVTVRPVVVEQYTD